jgi:HD superfamily phosphohydrolase
VPTHKPHTIVRDPVHGDIHLTAEELAILDTPEMQRLRGVRQLGTAYLVYPGAQHTRFEHSLGTMHLAQRMVDAINRNRALAPRELIGVAEDEARILRAAALVHDITHIPFGHSIEDQSGLLERHDRPARYLALLSPDTAVGRVLEDMGIRLEVLATLIPAEAEGPAGITPSGQLGLADPARPRDPLGAPQRPTLPRIPPYWREILSDTICADILDYLARDAYFTGLNLRYDERVVDYFKVDRATGHLFVDVAKRGLVREDILSELVRVLDARYFFSERVYYHHAKVAAGAMVEQVVATALAHGGLDPRALQLHSDESLWPLLEQHEPPYPEAAARYRELICRYRSRQLLKRACVFPLYANREVQDSLIARFFAPGRLPERTAFEAAIRQSLRDAGREPPLVVLYCPARQMQLKEAATHIRFPGDESIRPMSHFGAQIPRLADLERSYRDLWKLYVLAGTGDPAVLTRIGAIVAELLPEATNVYRPRE